MPNNNKIAPGRAHASRPFGESSAGKAAPSYYPPPPTFAQATAQRNGATAEEVINDIAVETSPQHAHTIHRLIDDSATDGCAMAVLPLGGSGVGCFVPREMTHTPPFSCNGRSPRSASPADSLLLALLAGEEAVGVGGCLNIPTDDAKGGNGADNSSSDALFLNGGGIGRRQSTAAFVAEGFGPAAAIAGSPPPFNASSRCPFSPNAIATDCDALSVGDDLPTVATASDDGRGTAHGGDRWGAPSSFTLHHYHNNNNNTFTHGNHQPSAYYYHHHNAANKADHKAYAQSNNHCNAAPIAACEAKGLPLRGGGGGGGRGSAIAWASAAVDGRLSKNAPAGGSDGQRASSEEHGVSNHFLFGAPAAAAAGGNQTRRRPSDSGGGDGFRTLLGESADARAVGVADDEDDALLLDFESAMSQSLSFRSAHAPSAASSAAAPPSHLHQQHNGIGAAAYSSLWGACSDSAHSGGVVFAGKPVVANGAAVGSAALSHQPPFSGTSCGQGQGYGGDSSLWAFAGSPTAPSESGRTLACAYDGANTAGGSVHAAMGTSASSNSPARGGSMSMPRAVMEGLLSNHSGAAGPSTLAAAGGGCTCNDGFGGAVSTCGNASVLCLPLASSLCASDAATAGVAEDFLSGTGGTCHLSPLDLNGNNASTRSIGLFSASALSSARLPHMYDYGGSSGGFAQTQHNGQQHASPSFYGNRQRQQQQTTGEKWGVSGPTLQLAPEERTFVRSFGAAVPPPPPPAYAQHSGNFGGHPPSLFPIAPEGSGIGADFSGLAGVCSPSAPWSGRSSASAYNINGYVGGPHCPSDVAGATVAAVLSFGGGRRSADLFASPDGRCGSASYTSPANVDPSGHAGAGWGAMAAAGGGIDQGESQHHDHSQQHQLPRYNQQGHSLPPPPPHQWGGFSGSGGGAAPSIVRPIPQRHPSFLASLLASTSSAQVEAPSSLVASASAAPSHTASFRGTQLPVVRQPVRSFSSLAVVTAAEVAQQLHTQQQQRQQIEGGPRASSELAEHNHSSEEEAAVEEEPASVVFVTPAPTPVPVGADCGSALSIHRSLFDPATGRPLPAAYYHHPEFFYTYLSDDEDTSSACTNSSSEDGGSDGGAETDAGGSSSSSSSSGSSSEGSSSTRTSNGQCQGGGRRRRSGTCTTRSSKSSNRSNDSITESSSDCSSLGGRHGSGVGGFSARSGVSSVTGPFLPRPRPPSSAPAPAAMNVSNLTTAYFDRDNNSRSNNNRTQSARSSAAVRAVLSGRADSTYTVASSSCAEAGRHHQQAGLGRRDRSGGSNGPFPPSSAAGAAAGSSYSARHSRTASALSSAVRLRIVKSGGSGMDRAKTSGSTNFNTDFYANNKAANSALTNNHRSVSTIKTTTNRKKKKNFRKSAEAKEESVSNKDGHEKSKAKEKKVKRASEKKKTQVTGGNGGEEEDEEPEYCVIDNASRGRAVATLLTSFMPLPAHRSRSPPQALVEAAHAVTRPSLVSFTQVVYAMALLRRLGVAEEAHIQQQLEAHTFRQHQRVLEAQQSEAEEAAEAARQAQLAVEKQTVQMKEKAAAKNTPPTARYEESATDEERFPHGHFPPSPSAAVSSRTPSPAHEAPPRSPSHRSASGAASTHADAEVCEDETAAHIATPLVSSLRSSKRPSALDGGDGNEDDHRFESEMEVEMEERGAGRGRARSVADSSAPPSDGFRTAVGSSHFGNGRSTTASSVCAGATTTVATAGGHGLGDEGSDNTSRSASSVCVSPPSQPLITSIALRRPPALPPLVAAPPLLSVAGSAFLSAAASARGTVTPALSSSTAATSPASAAGGARRSRSHTPLYHPSSAFTPASARRLLGAAVLIAGKVHEDRYPRASLVAAAVGLKMRREESVRPYTAAATAKKGNARCNVAKKQRNASVTSSGSSGPATAAPSHAAGVAEAFAECSVAGEVGGFDDAATTVGMMTPSAVSAASPPREGHQDGKAGRKRGTDDGAVVTSVEGNPSSEVEDKAPLSTSSAATTAYTTSTTVAAESSLAHLKRTEALLLARLQWSVHVSVDEYKAAYDLLAAVMEEERALS